MVARTDVRSKNRVSISARGWLVGLGVALASAPALAQEAAPLPPPAAAPLASPPPPAAPLAPPPPAAAPSTGPTVGGHIGVATSFVTIAKETTTISDRSGIDNPIGISVKFPSGLVFDFETIVSTAVHPKGGTAFTVDPGVVYNWGPVATGLRIASHIGAPANVGFIPLINKGLVDLGGAGWFIEAAFPIFIVDSQASLDLVLHTGIGF